LLKGAAAAAAASSIPLSEALASVASTTAEKQAWTLQYRIVYNYIIERSFASSYKLNELAQVQVKSGKHDRRKYGAKSLKPMDVTIKAIVPPGAMPWRYLEHSGQLPLKFRLRMRKAKEFRIRSNAVRYLVVSNKGKTTLLPCQRMRRRRYKNVDIEPVAQAS
jgi:hypothetical protein